MQGENGDWLLCALSAREQRDASESEIFCQTLLACEAYGLEGANQTVYALLSAHAHI
jgi:hypothetical protein